MPSPPGKFITSKTLDRGRRCQNCIHFDNGEAARKLYESRRLDEARVRAAEHLARTGQLPAVPGAQRIGSSDPGMDHFAKNFAMGDSYMEAGLLGICLKGKVNSDFVHAMYLCEGWTQRVKPDGADEKRDETSEEAKNRLGYDA